MVGRPLTPDDYFALMDTAPKDSKGACFSCGFLSIRLHSPGEPIEEANKFVRHGGDLWHGVDGTDGAPYCYVQATDFINDLGEDFTPERRYYGVRRLILKDRKCPKWFPYTVGRSPEKVWEHRSVVELERLRQDFTRGLERDRKDWEERLDQRRREGVERSEQAASQFNVQVIVIGLIGLGLAVLATMPEATRVETLEHIR